MTSMAFQLIGRRIDRPQALMFRDREGRHFLRADCGAPLVRITTRDAQRMLRHDAYYPVLDSEWRSIEEATALECIVPIDQAVELHQG